MKRECAEWCLALALSAILSPTLPTTTQNRARNCSFPDSLPGTARPLEEKRGSVMRRLGAAASLLMCLLRATNTCGQTRNASVGGFVQDPTQAFIPGVTITATNTQTGVAISVVTNESGTYNIPSLLPGTYKLSAE